MRNNVLKSRPVSDEIPTSPMADIAFLLVIFFMITMTFASSRGLDFSIEEPPRDVSAEKVEAVLVQVLAGGSLIVDGRDMELSQLLGYLAPKLAANSSKPVILAPKPDAQYGYWIAVYDELRLGRAKLGLAQDIEISLPAGLPPATAWY